MPPRTATGPPCDFALTATGSLMRTRTGSPRPAGLTMLEAAAVDGEELVVEALAAALGPAFRAAPLEARVAVAMSGGVDSAVALAARRQRRPWSDPAAVGRPRGAARRARLLFTRCRASGPQDVPWPRSSSCDARPARGVPPRGRRPVRPWLRARRDAEPVHPLQRRVPLRRAARICTARRRRPSRNGALRPDSAPQGQTAAGASRRPRQGPVVHARGARSGPARAGLVPARRPDEGRHAGRGSSRLASRQRGGGRARRRASSAATTTAPSSSGAALKGAEGPIVDTSGKVLGRHDGHWRFTPGQRRGLGVASAEPLYALRTIAGTNTVVAGPREALACRSLSARGGCTCPSSGRTRSSAIGFPRCPLASRRRQRASGSSSISRRSASLLDRRPCSTRTMSSSDRA